VLLAVSDTGSGMSEEVRRRAFEPFFTTKPPGKGSGLGLSQVHGVVTQLGGAVTIDSTEGVGTTVRIFLPRTDLTEEVQDAGRIAVQTSVARRVGRILLVDDDPEVRELTMTYLVDLGYDVLEASDGEGGLELIEDNPDIDAMLADFAMPGMNGAMLVREARKIRPDLPVLMLTGYAADAAEEISAAGVTIVSKPYKLADLESAVGQLLSSVQRPHSVLS
jgi:CheY-like chemotaxis protein